MSDDNERLSMPTAYEQAEDAMRDAMDAGATDSDGEPCNFLNLYRCDDCGTEWQDQWSCACDDRCPTCDAEVEPFHSYVD